MLDNLIESRNHIQEKKKLGSFMLTISIMVTISILAAMVYSLFSQNIVLGADNLEISTLIAPVEIIPRPEPVDQPKIDRSDNKSASTNVPMRKTNTQQINESPVAVPKSISVTPSNVVARPNSTFLIGNTDTNPVSEGPRGSARAPGRGTGLLAGNEGASTPAVAKNGKIEETPPPIVPKPEKVPPIVSGGVVNGKARVLVTPVYSATARNLGLKGEVKVQVMIDENGDVISASAVSGHALLRSSAVTAARASKFTPTTLSLQRVKVTGVIVYNFS